MTPQQLRASRSPASIAALAPRHTPGGGDQLLADARVASLLAREARDRAMGRMFGVSKDEAGLLFLIALLMAGQTMHGAGKRVLAPGRPMASDGMLMAATARELVFRAAGLPPDAAPLVGTLLAGAVAVTMVRRASARSGRAIRAASATANGRFHHRYGYLVDPGHWREHRATRRFFAMQSAASQ